MGILRLIGVLLGLRRACVDCNHYDQIDPQVEHETTCYATAFKKYDDYVHGRWHWEGRVLCQDRNPDGLCPRFSDRR